MSSRRAVWRWGWRLLRKEWREQTLIIGLVFGMVTLSIAASVLAFNISPPDGGIDSIEGFTFNGDPAAVAQANELASERTTVMQRGRFRPPGAVNTVDLFAFDLQRPETNTMINLTAGSYPVGPGEIAATDGAAKFLAAELRETLQLDDATVTITGIVEDPTNLNRDFVFLDVNDPPPLEIERFYLGSEGILYQGTGDTFTELEERGLRVEPFGGNDGGFKRSDSNIVSAVITTLAMMIVGLIVSSAFAVAGRRRVRQYGMLGAIGANEQHLRGAAAFNGFALGVLAAVAGVVLGLVVAAAALPVMEGALAYRVNYEVPATLVVLIAVLAVAMSTIAAWWPARSIARQPVTEALAARRPRSRPVRNTTVAGLVATIGGYVLLATTLDAEGATVTPFVGMAATVVGVMLLTPAVISAIGNVTRRAALPVRIAGRDLSRFQSRAAAALAAVVLALAIPLAIGLLTAQFDAHEQGKPANLAEDTAIMWSPDRADTLADSGDASDVLLLDGFTDFDAVALRAEIADALPSVTITAIDMLVDTRQGAFFNDRGQAVAETRTITRETSCSPSNDYNMSFGNSDGERCYFSEQPWVATTELTELWDIAAPGADVDLITGVEGTWEDWSEIGGHTSLRSTVAAVPNFSSFSGALINESSIRPTDQRVTAGWILTSPRAFTTEEVSTLRSLMGDRALVETTTSPSDDGSTRIIAALVGMLVGFAVLAATVTLIRSESAEDTRILNVLGASSPMRRSVAASTAALLALGGAVLALPLGIIGLIVDRVFEGPEGYPYAVPWSTLLILFVLFPILAAIGSGVLAPNTKELR